MKVFDLQPSMEALLKFRRERDWEQFHTPKNLSMSIAIESAELMEHFQWKTEPEVRDYLETGARGKVEEEIADVASYLLLLSHDLGLDLNDCIRNKIKKNEEKYPVEKSRGRNTKYDQL